MRLINDGVWYICFKYLNMPGHTARYNCTFPIAADTLNAKARAGAKSQMQKYTLAGITWKSKKKAWNHLWKILTKTLDEISGCCDTWKNGEKLIEYLSYTAAYDRTQARLNTSVEPFRRCHHNGTTAFTVPLSERICTVWINGSF